MPHPFDAQALEAAVADDARLLEEATSRFPARSPDADGDRESLRRAVALLDLTSLRGDERPDEVEALCQRASEPLPGSSLHTAAVCVFPEHVAAARRTLAAASVRVVAACFGPEPGAGVTEDRLAEIARALDAGADFIKTSTGK
jgi:deoxyribose-phosphate aldolase